MNTPRPAFRSFFRSLTCLAMGLLSSCTVVQGDRNKGTYLYATVGGDAHGLAQTADGMTAETLTTSASFQDLSKTIRSGIYMGAAKAITQSVAGAYKSVSNARTAADVSKHAAAEGTKQAQIQADLTRETFVPPEAAAAPAP